MVPNGKEKEEEEKAIYLAYLFGYLYIFFTEWRIEEKKRIDKKDRTIYLSTYYLYYVILPFLLSRSLQNERTKMKVFSLHIFKAIL